MKIKEISIINGRNIYSHNPVIQMVVDLERLSDKTTNEYEDFNEYLLELFPYLKDHHCGLGRYGGFVERLKEGTYFGHVLEHMVLELQVILGYDVFFGKTRMKEEPSLYSIIFEYGNENVAIECVKESIRLIYDIINNKSIDMEYVVGNLFSLKEQWELGPSTKAIYDEAKKRGIPVRRLGNESIIELGYGKYSRLVQSAILDSTSSIAVDIASNKMVTKQLLKENNVPVPSGGLAYTKEEAVRIANEIGYPVVIKPVDANQGKGVILNINSNMELKKYFNIPAKINNGVMVEKQISGKDYRVLVIKDKVCAVAERTAPEVTGDGIHTIRELVEIENESELRGIGHERPLTKIKLDNISQNYLKKNNLSQDTVLNEGETVKLRENGNLSTGGSAKECTDKIHPENIKIAVEAAKTIGLDIAGVDIIAQDISKPIDESEGAVIEINASPGLRMHIHPSSGRSINVASHIIDSMYPKGKPHSIPIIAVTGTNGKTTTTRLIGHTLSLMGKKVGMTTTSGIYFGSKCVLKGDNTGPISARKVLNSKKIDTAVLEVARGGIIRKGLGYDLADVGVLTNISDDHIGIDGIDSMEDLAFVKSLVIEAVKPDGYSVLNADDGMIEYFLGRASGNIILFSKNISNKILQEHIKDGKTAFCAEDNKIYFYSNSSKFKLIDLSRIPITFGGFLECNIENALAASAALYGLNTPINIISKGLESFKSDISMNPGRFNIFDMGDIKIMLDYGHNIGGYEEVGKFISKMNVSRSVGVIGVPGDRSDESIINIGEKCAGIFKKIYIKEDADLRGRKPGEVANLLYKGLVKVKFDPYNIKIILPEIEAFKIAISEAEDGDLITLFYEEFTPALDLVTKLQYQIRKKTLDRTSNTLMNQQKGHAEDSNIHI